MKDEEINKLKTSYKYIYFMFLANKKKTSVWICCSQKDNEILGNIEWYPRWRQYCFFPEKNTVFNISCLENINSFIKQLRTIEIEYRKL